MSNVVIGPIDLPTWYCMRQCRESIQYLKTKKDPKYDVEIHGEQAILQTYYDEIFNRKAA